MTKDEALHKALKVLNCLNNDRVYETAWVKGAINACEEALEQPKNTQPLDEVIEEFMKDPAMKQAMDKAREKLSPLFSHPTPQTAQEPIDVVQIKKDAEQTLQDLKSMNAKFAKENGKPIHIHLWSLSGGLKFDLREPNPETMVMDFYLGSIEIKQATQLAFNIKELQYNKLTGVK